MNPNANLSRMAFVAVILSAVFAGCDRTGGYGSSAGTAPGPASSSGAADSGTSASGGASDTSSSGTSGTSSRSSAGAVIEDSIVSTKVKTALLADEDIKGTDIVVETKKGEVLLSGFVKNQAQIDKAVKVASAVEGVKKVDNKMVVKQ